MTQCASGPLNVPLYAAETSMLSLSLKYGYR